MLMNGINIISNVSLNNENSIDISFYKQASRARATPRSSKPRG